MRRINPLPKPTDRALSAFTVVELLVVIGTIALLLLVIGTAVTKATPISKRSQCTNNLRQLTSASAAWCLENSDSLLSCAGANTAARANWMNGTLDFNGANRSNWDTNQDLRVSPIWTIVGRSPNVFRCPADASTVKVSGVVFPRLRSYSMSGV